MTAETRLLERLTASDLFLLMWDRNRCPVVAVFAQGVRGALDDLAA